MFGARCSGVECRHSECWPGAYCVAMRLATRCPSCQLHALRQLRRYAERTLPEGSSRPSRLRLTRFLSTETSYTATSQEFVPFRKQLKDEAKAKRSSKRKGDGAAKKSPAATRNGWELTVGIEVHAQLDSSYKLFSSKVEQRCVWLPSYVHV